MNIEEYDMECLELNEKIIAKRCELGHLFGINTKINYNNFSKNNIKEKLTNILNELEKKIKEVKKSYFIKIEKEVI